MCLLLAYSAHRKDQERENWSRTTGMVTSSEVVRTTIARLRIPARSATPPPQPTYHEDPVWAIEVSYRYSAGGKDRIGHDATSRLIVEEIRGDASGPGAELAALAGRIPPGVEHDVYFDPGDPGESYLVYVDSPGKASLFRVGVVCLLVGAMVALGGKLFG